MKRPTLDEVRAYCTERDNTVDPEAWLDHYTANGFKVGANPMKDWKAAVRTWERNRKQKESPRHETHSDTAFPNSAIERVRAENRRRQAARGESLDQPPLRVVAGERLG